MAKLKNTGKEMSFLDHLEDLRWHLIRSFLSVIVLASVAFLAKDFISINKSNETPWDDIKHIAISLINEHYISGNEVVIDKSLNDV